MISFNTDNPKRELMTMLQDHIAGARNHRYRIDESHFQALMQKQGIFFSYLPEVAFVQVLHGDGSASNYSLLHNRAHLNNAQMFDEQKRLAPAEDRLTVVDGFIGSYPNMFFQLTAAEMAGFTGAIETMGSATTTQNWWSATACAARRPGSGNSVMSSITVTSAHSRSKRACLI